MKSKNYLGKPDENRGILIALAIFLIAGTVAFFYKPIYSVTINGEMVGYSVVKNFMEESFCIIGEINFAARHICKNISND